MTIRTLLLGALVAFALAGLSIGVAGAHDAPDQGNETSETTDLMDHCMELMNETGTDGMMDGGMSMEGMTDDANTGAHNNHDGSGMGCH